MITNSNITNKEKELLEKLKKLIIKLGRRKNYYEIFNLFFITENLLSKEKFNNILNNIDKDIKIKILEKMIEVNNIHNFDTDFVVIDTKKWKFNTQINKFIKKIEFLN